MLADAYVKHLNFSGSINWTESYTAVKKDAEVVSANNFDPEDLSSSTKEGLGALKDWLKYGFVTLNYARAISRTIEYSLNGFAVHQIAQGEASSSEATVYLNRSAGWQHIWNHNITSLNFAGFLAPMYPTTPFYPTCRTVRTRP